MQKIQFDIPDDVLAALDQTPESLPMEIRMAAAAKLFELGKLSSGRAAELAGVERTEFLESIGLYGVDSFKISAAEVEQDLGNA